jgi:hypothetical protein
MSSGGNASSDPILVVDGFQWDLSNLTIGSGYSSNEVRPEDHSNSPLSRRSSERSFAAYPRMSEIPACLDVNDIFDKLKANNMLRKGRVANPQLLGLSASELDQKRLSRPSPSSLRRNRSSSSQSSSSSGAFRVEPRRRSSRTHDNMAEDRSRHEEYRRRDEHRRHDEGYRRQERSSYNGRSSSSSRMRHRNESDYERSSHDDHRPQRPREEYSSRTSSRERYSSRSSSRERYSSRSSSRDGGHRRRQRREEYHESERGGRDEYYQEQSRIPQQEEYSHHQRRYNDDYLDDDCYDEQPSEQVHNIDIEEDRIMVEVTPGYIVPLRGSAETWSAVQCGRIIKTMCFSCMWQLVCIKDADLVMCPGCRVISPVTEGVGGGGLGLGMKEEDASFELNALKQKQAETKAGLYR